MKILFGFLEVFISDRYAKFQSANSILKGIFTTYTMKTLKYCRKDVFAPHNSSIRKVFVELYEQKKSFEACSGKYGG